MAETVGYAFIKARGYLNQYTEDGVVIPEADIVDMKMRAILLADTAQKKIYRYARLDATKETPDKITSVDDNLEVNDLGVEAVALYIASKLAPFSNKELVNYYEEEYEHMVDEIKKPVTITDITDVYGGDE